MSDPIRNRYDFVLVFDVQDGNPNGDPDAGNLPRLDAETGCGLVTDVCLKRKVRNFVEIVKQSQPGYEIYVREKAVLGRAHVKAFSELGINTGQGASMPVPASLEPLFSDLVLPEGITYLDVAEEGGDRIEVAPDADKAEIKAWIKENKPPKQVVDLILAVMKEAKPRKPTADETQLGRLRMMKDYYDIRTFGAVLSLKSAPNCGQVRGPVQMTFGRSVDPIVTSEHSITRMAVATEAEAEKQGGDNRTMGRKNTVPYGVYVTHGFISANLAAQTGFSQEDLDLFWDALKMMFEHDRSAARGMMATRKLVVFRHDSALGNAPAHQLFDLVTLRKKDESKPARNFSDYECTVTSSGVPAGVSLMELV
ncbi:MAG: type I-C CRISPR-associated protein Cas7/Csd2 [Candidatus Fermentibacter sp.]|nr:type I-C CRISPR-associated protein Cas7/Csd2 [Candidatus Fermentibacter sp.]